MKIAIVGFGTMGRQIAQLLAQHGHVVEATDPIKDALSNGIVEIQDGPYGLRTATARGKLTSEQAREAFRRISTTPRLEQACQNADLVIEAAIEELKLKQELFQKIEKAARPGATLATNTSTLSVTKIASITHHKERIVGIHFFNPAQVTKLVEIIRGSETSQETVDSSLNLVRGLGKTPVLARDEPGFIANRLGLSLFIEASRMLEDNIASITDIDTTMKLGYGHPMGPFETADLVGLDTRLRNLESLYRYTNDTKWLPPTLLRELVNQGYLGDGSKNRESKGGYYDYFNIEQEPGKS